MKKDKQGRVLSGGKNLQREQQALALVKGYLNVMGIGHQPSDNRTYDLKTDLGYLELKLCNPKDRSRIVLTENQYSGLKSGELQWVFQVIIPGNIVMPFTREELLGYRTKVISRYQISVPIEIK